MRPLIPHFALFAVNVIYGINYTVAKDVMEQGYMKPFGFIMVRVIGALVLFQFVQQVFIREKVARKDLLRLAICGTFGVAANQLLFFKGLNSTSPVDAAIIMITIPIAALVFSFLILKDRISKGAMAGVLIGLAGAVTLTLVSQDRMGANAGEGSSIVGNFLVMLNACSFGLYLVLVKPLMKKYKPITVITWVFTFGFLVVVPFGFGEFTEISWQIMPQKILLEVGFVVLFTTFFAYLLNIFALKSLTPTAVSSYVYLQPVLATVFAVWLANYAVTWTHAACSVLVFSGVYLATRK